MLWSEFVAHLDSLRTKIRSERNLKSEVLLDDSILSSVFQLSELPSKLASVQRQPEEPAKLAIEDALLATAPEETPEPRIVDIVERGDGQGRMIVMGRDKPFIPRKPLLEEVFDEKDLGK